jgi:phosphatidate phosphatase PAH1
MDEGIQESLMGESVVSGSCSADQSDRSGLKERDESMSDSSDKNVRDAEDSDHNKPYTAGVEEKLRDVWARHESAGKTKWKK